MNKTKPLISDKDTIRSEMKRGISLLSDEEKKNAAESLSEKLLDSPHIQGAQNIISYQALNDEMNLAPFLKAIEKQGKNIFNIDPKGNASSLPNKGVILVPGRAFTLTGKRIGRGGGWYDIFLQEHPQLYTIGVGFGCQIFPELPQDIWDITMDKIIVG